jgi:hypothetical protein
MKKKPTTPSQLMELFLAVTAELGFSDDQDIAALADAGPENVANWRSGAVKEFKNQKFRAALDSIVAQLRALRAQAGSLDARLYRDLSALEIEEGSSPADLQRQFRDRVGYDYLGHRFLYFEPQGALAWENLIKAGYEQDRWLVGVEDCARAWLSTDKEVGGQPRGPIARALGFGRRERLRGLDVVSLGPGDGGKEMRLLELLLEREREVRQRLAWLAFAPVDVSIALLMAAARSARELLLDGSAPSRAVLPFCGDFEEGSLAFARRLRSALATSADGLRLVLVLGNVLGNLRDEEIFVRQKLCQLARPGDLVWFEVGLRFDRIEDDPLFALTQSDRKETAGDANRRLLLEGPYRRWAAATGRGSPSLDSRVWVREDDDSSRVPGSCNFCHDLVIKDERRVCTMLYSRRYKLDKLATWFEGLGFELEDARKVTDGRGRERVGHLLLRRR